jgi:hypothetical protein
MVRKERIPSWRKIGFGFELAGEVLEEDEGGDEVEKEGRKGILAAAA